MDLYTDTVVDALQIPVGTYYATHVPIHAVNVSGGSKNLVLAQFEATNPLSYTVGLGRYVRRSDGARIGPATMDNITPAMHHRVVNLGVWDAQPIMNATYSLVVYAIASAAKPGDSIKIEQGYGFLQVMVFE